MKHTFEQLAKMIDHSLLHPTMTDQELEDSIIRQELYFHPTALITNAISALSEKRANCARLSSKIE